MLPSRQDISTLNSHLQNYIADFSLTDPQDAFICFILDYILNLQPDEIEDAITDNNYLIKRGKRQGGHDRGIDAVYIEIPDNPQKKPIVHLFNCKYKSSINNITDHFPASEIDKVINFLNSLFSLDYGLFTNANPILTNKVYEIWQLLETNVADFVIHLCTNGYAELESGENERFHRLANLHSNITIAYTLMPDLVKLITKKGKQLVNARFKAIDKNFFEKSDGDIRALIVNVDAYELVRIVLDSETIRHKVDLGDYAEITNSEYQILEDAFEDNVRIYARQRTKINQGIKKTALSEESPRFFYYNNGITITCTHFQYAKTMRAPIVELENLQIVNGGQTIHALFEALKEKPEQLEHINLLCRIYETHNRELSTKIAEYTNSQNPVSSRDIRAIDPIQQKLEADLAARGYFYERKKNQHSTRPKSQRLDAEKVGQVLLAFFNEMEADPKDKKAQIFGRLYDIIFTDEITADQVLLAYQLFEYVEQKKFEAEQLLRSSDNQSYDEGSYVLYSSYYLLYIMGKLAEKEGISRVYSNLGAIQPFYEEANTILRKIIKEQRGVESRKYSHPVFLKSSRPKQLFEEHLKTIN